MKIHVRFHDEQTGYTEPVFMGDEAQLKDHFTTNEILNAKEVDKLLEDGYYISKSPSGEFFWEDING